MESKFKWVLSLSFEDVPPPVNFYQIPKLTVSSNGVMTMNQPLQKALDCACPIHMQISEDGRVIKLTSVENGDQHFSSKGQLKNASYRFWFASSASLLISCCTLRFLRIGTGTALTWLSSISSTTEP